MEGKAPIADRGSEPFIFVSYAHADFDLVSPELERVKRLGFDVWYDEGIHAGRNWTDELAQRLSECAMVVYFVTPNSVLSRHCANEVHFALDMEKPMLVVHLRPATLPPGQRMQLGTIQAILKYELTEPAFEQKLGEALNRLMADSVARARGSLPRLPMGTVTLLRLDIVRAHELALQLQDGFTEVLTRLRDLVRGLAEQNDGQEVEMRGDICMMVFVDARRAVRAAADIQSACAATVWPENAALRVRIGVHTGQPTVVDDQYFGLDVQRVIQIANIASGGQVLLSAETRAQVPNAALPSQVKVRDLGTHRLKDMPFPEVLHDLVQPGLPSEFDPVASLTNRPTNLPKTLSSFVGRVRELDEICALVREGQSHILTLTGPGGTGKTRLSIEAARQLEAEFPDGVFLVKLAAIKDPGLVLTAIAETMGIKELPGRTPLQTLVHRLAESRLLLVMDNFEQVLEGALNLLELLDGAPHLRLIVSSREPLSLRGERVYPVEPLQLPELDPARRRVALEDVESVQLFIERVREFKPGFVLDRANERAIASICLKLDGLPLALELAAARMGILSPSALLDNLDRTLDVLKARSQDLPDRQRTLKSTVEWSYNLLEDDEKSLFRRLSVFRGGFTLSAAQVVVPDEEDEFALLDRIESLVNKSLLKSDPNRIEPRFTMLETIREYGLAALEANAETATMRERHAAYFLDLAEALAPGLIGRQQRACATRLIADADNLRASMAWFLERREAGLLTRMFRSLWWLWIPRGNFSEGRDWVQRALGRFDTLEPGYEKALIHESSAWLDALAGDYAAAAPDLEICHEIYQSAGDDADVARVRLSLGLTRAVLQVPGGAELSQQALDTFEELEDEYHYALALVSRGITFLVEEDIPGAADAWQRALEVFRKIGNSYWPGQMLLNLAHFRVQAGDGQGAVGLVMEALGLAREFDYPMIANLCLLAMGGVSVQRGQFAEAARLFGALEASLDRLGVVLEPLEQVYFDAYSGVVREHLDERDLRNAMDEGAGWSEKEIESALLAAGDSAA